MASLWSTLANVFTVIRTIASKDSTTLSDATLLPLANKYYYLLVRELIGLNEDLYAELSYTDIVSAQKEYPLPIDDTTGTAADKYGGGLIKIQRVEISYDGSSWKVAEGIPFTDIKTPTILDTDIAAYYTTSNPKYYFKDKSVWIIPVPKSTDAVTAGNAGLRIFWIKRPAEFTATTDIPDLPKDWLSILQEGILYDVFRKFGKTNDARDALANWQLGISRMKELEQNISQKETMSLKTIYKSYK